MSSIPSLNGNVFVIVIPQRTESAESARSLSRMRDRACMLCRRSFINGTVTITCLGWVGRVCAAMRASGRDLTLYNLGIRRDTSADIAVRWLDETSRRLPQGVDGLVVFSFGVNDTTLGYEEQRVTPDQSVANAREVLRTARGR